MALTDLFPGSQARLAHDLVPYRVMDDTGALVAEPPLLSPEQLPDLYRWMVFGRQLDLRGLQLQRQGRVGIWGPISGEEAAQAGLALAMAEGDWLFSSYRQLLTICMRGVPLTETLAYLQGRYWLSNPAEHCVFPIQILIGDQSLHAAGAAHGFQLQQKTRVAVAAIGDGATSEGDFHEAMNYAGVFQVPCVFFVENNGWAISTPRQRQTASASLAQKAVAYGMPGVQVDGNDALAVLAVCRWAIERARQGQGPSLVEAVTYRLGAHTTSDDPSRYQPSEELAAWRERDPLPRLRRHLERQNLWTDPDEQKAVEDALHEIDEAMAALERSPALAPERMFETTYASPTPGQLDQRQWLRTAREAEG